MGSRIRHSINDTVGDTAICFKRSGNVKLIDLALVLNGVNLWGGGCEYHKE